MTAGKRFFLNRDGFIILGRDGFIFLGRDGFIVLGRDGFIVLGRDSLLLIVSFTQKKQIIKRSLSNFKYLLENFRKLEITLTAGKRFFLNRDGFIILGRDGFIFLGREGFIALGRDGFIVLGRDGFIVLGRDSLLLIVSFTHKKNKFIKRSLSNLKYLLEQVRQFEIPMTAGKRFRLNRDGFLVLHRDGFIVLHRDGFIVLGRDGFIVLGRDSLLLIVSFTKKTIY